MEVIGISLGAIKVFGGAALLGLAIYLPCWALARMGKGYRRFERRQRESAWSIQLIPD